MTIREEVLELVKEEMEGYTYDYPSLEDIESATASGLDIIFVEHEFDDWDDQGKYQYREEVYEACEWSEGTVKHLGIFFSQQVQRSGSYFSDYHYTNDAPVEVELHTYEKTITVREWVAV